MSISHPAPNNPQEIERGWLEETLRGSAEESLVLEDFEWESIGQGKGFVGQLARLRLTGRGVPASLIAKFPSADPQLRALCQRYRLFEREVRFYREMATSVALQTPFVYCAEGGDEFGVLLLEDLSARGMVAADNDKGATAVQAATTLCQLARAQAEYWGPPSGRLPSWLPRFDTHAEHNQQTFQKLWQPFLAAASILAPEHGFSDLFIELGESFSTSVADFRRRLARPPQTLVHGDFRLDNLFYSPDAADLTVIDWQIVQCGCGLLDVAHFLCGSLEPEQRRKSERGLLELYHQTLCAHGVRDYSFARCLHEYRLALLYVFSRMVAAGAMLGFGSREGRAYFATGIARREAAFVDHDLVGLIREGLAT